LKANAQKTVAAAKDSASSKKNTPRGKGNKTKKSKSKSKPNNSNSKQVLKPIARSLLFMVSLLIWINLISIT
jgi:hypothetical protein